MRVVIVIPARFSSSRFPGKPLALINGIPMIKRVWQRSCDAIGTESVIIATDDSKIQDYCLANNISNVVMTSVDCLTGTDRVAEVATKIDADVFVNVQGDEPLVNPQDIIKIIDYYKNNDVDIVNAMSKIRDEKEYFSSSVPKVVFNDNNDLLYMSRAAIPSNKNNMFIKAWKQVCIYAFSKKSLMDYYSMCRKTVFESIEDIEILRFLELGYSVKMVELYSETIAVDYPEDILAVEAMLK